MKVRQAEFAMVPSWVLRHPQIRGRGPVIATYAVLRMVAYENPDYDWGSMRVIAKAIAPDVGLGEEAIRKHLSVLSKASVITVVGDVLEIPSDDPGYDLTQPADPGKILSKPGEDFTRIPLLQESNRYTTDSAFESFWALCPRKEGKGAAMKAWRGLSSEDRDAAAAAMPSHSAAWRKKYPDGSKQFIPHPSTWLNQRRWEDEIDAVQSDTVMINGAAVARSAL